MLSQAAAQAMTASAPQPEAGVIGRSTIFLLGGIAALGSLATQLLVPALPSIAGDLGVGIASAQLVVGVFLIGLGGGQLLVGPVADRMERRKLLLLGLLLYGLGSLAAGFAGSLAVLLVARLVQAIGASAGLVTARVLLNAMVPPEKAVSAQASLMAIVLISPALAPVIGGLLTEWLGWRSIMLGLCGACLITALVVRRHIPAGTSTARPVAPVSLRGAYRRLMRNRRFLAATGAMGFSSAALYLFLGAAPFLLENGYRLTPRETGLCLLLIACASIAGTRLVGRVQRSTDALRPGTGLGLTAVIVLGAVSLGGAPSLPLLLAPIALLGLTAGLIGPTAIAHILSSEPGLEGTATSLAGAMQLSVSAVFAWLLGPFAAQSAWHLAVALLPLTCAATGAAIAAGGRARA